LSVVTESAHQILVERLKHGGDFCAQCARIKPGELEFCRQNRRHSVVHVGEQSIRSGGQMVQVSIV